MADLGYLDLFGFWPDKMGNLDRKGLKRVNSGYLGLFGIWLDKMGNFHLSLRHIQTQHNKVYLSIGKVLRFQ